MSEVEYKQEMPLVQVDDDGIRPAGTPDRCFYCEQAVGAPHLRDCVVVTKTIQVRYEFILNIDIPWEWEKDTFERHHNESTWCADNALSDLNDYQEKLDGNGHCLCGIFKATYLKDIDSTPKVARIKHRNNE